MKFREAKYRLRERKQMVSGLQELLRVQKSCLDDQYMVGLYNGLALAVSVITGDDPGFVPTGETVLGGETIPQSDEHEDDLDYDAWCVIANAYGGDWSLAPKDWCDAATRWRDAFHASMA